ncbi:MAG: very short patch repair endonuclease [Candidatus Zixiibacteriota bacterium]
MTDVLTKAQRSYCMSRIRDKDTQPELMLRKAIWSAGIKGYRLHYNLPGNPDIVFPKSKIVVFIDGCFWHKCPKCFIKPTTNWRFWKKKIDTNVKRDKIVNAELRKKGWKVIRFWEHQIRSTLDRCYIRVHRELEKRDSCG